MVSDHGRNAMAATIPAGEFKAKCLKIIDEVAEKRQVLVVTKRGKPVVQVAPIPAKQRDIVGSMKGSVCNHSWRHRFSDRCRVGRVEMSVSEGERSARLLIDTHTIPVDGRRPSATLGPETGKALNRAARGRTHHSQRHHTVGDWRLLSWLPRSASTCIGT